MCLKNNNRTYNPRYDNDCKIARKEIRDAPSEIVKIKKINMYNDLIKRKKRSYINRRQGHLLHFSKVEPRKFWGDILAPKIKENNSIPLKNWDLFLKNLYDSSNTMGNVSTL